MTRRGLESCRLLMGRRLSQETEKEEKGNSSGSEESEKPEKMRRSAPQRPRRSLLQHFTGLKTTVTHSLI